MKIFGTFDTERSIIDFKRSISKYGDGNVILIKKHWSFLIYLFVYVIIALFMMIALIYLTYLQYFDNYFYLFVVIIFLYLLVTGQWLFVSTGIYMNFFNNYMIKWNKEEDIKKKSMKKFDNFLRKSIFSFICQIVIGVANLGIAIYLSQGTYQGIFAVIGQFIVNMGFIYVVYVFVKKMVDFEMDYTIFTPSSITDNQQSGFLEIQIKSVEASQIKSITEIQKGIFNSFFGYGRLDIKAIGDKSGDISSVRLNYVGSPKKISRMIKELLRIKK